MNSDDAAVFQQAINLANSGQQQAAYDQLCAIRNRGNDNNPDVLLWIAFTTPYQSEAQQALDTVTRLAPSHPGLPEARAYQAQRWQQQAQPYQQQYAQPYQHYQQQPSMQ